MMDRKWDVVIVGGGLACFVAANFLAKNDLSIKKNQNPIDQPS